MFFDFDRESERERITHLSITNSQLRSQIILNRWIDEFIHMKLEELDSGFSVYIIPNHAIFYIGYTPSTVFYPYPKKQCDIIIDYSLSRITPYYANIFIVMQNCAGYLSKTTPKIKGSLLLFKDISILNADDIE